MNSEANLQTRSYQKELIRTCIAQNTIIWLPTGSGKTLIALLVLKYFFLKNPSKHVFFLVPTVALGFQQYEILSANMPCKVSFIYGDRNVDFWTMETWKKELDEHSCIVITAQVFLDGLRHAFIDKNSISTVVFDECHHGVKGHPYKLIMNEMRMSILSCRILGLSASPSKASAIESLESIFGSKIVMPDDPNEIYEYVSRAEVVTCGYTKEKVDTLSIVGTYNAEINYIYEEFGYMAVKYILKHLYAKGILRQRDISESDKLWLSEKVIVLKSLLEAEYQNDKNIKCIIFVKRRISAIVLSYILSLILENEINNPRVAIGLNGGKRSTKPQLSLLFNIDSMESINDFKNDKANILIATSVCEEGIDVSACNVVIRFDIPENMISFVQSRGRARKSNSKYIILHDLNDPRQVKLVDKFQAEEVHMEKIVRNRNHQNLEIKDYIESDELDKLKFSSEKTGASITPRSSVSLLNRYCQTLSSSGSLVLKPVFNIKNSFSCSIEMPMQCILDLSKINFDENYSSKKMAKSFSCFKLCKALYEESSLNEYFLPDIDDLFRQRKSLQPLSESSQFNMKRTILNESFPHNYSGVAIKEYLKLDVEEKCPVNFIMCTLEFKEGDTPSIAILIRESLSMKSIIEEALENINIPTSEFHIHSSNVSCLSIENLDHLLQIQIFTQCFLSVVDLAFDDTIIHDFLSFAIVPVDQNNNIDWKLIIDTIQCLPFVSDEKKSIQVDSVAYCKVTSGHRRFFHVTEISAITLEEKLPPHDAEILKAETFHQLMISRFGKTLAPNDTLVKVKAIKIYDKNNVKKVCDISNSEHSKSFAKKIYSNNYSALSVLSFYPISKGLIKYAVLIPLILDEISANLTVSAFPFKNYVPDFLDLKQSLTDRCIDRFSNYERREFLGDSVLKLLASFYVISKYPTKPEGFLSVSRDLIINNRNLCNVSMKNSISWFLINESVIYNKKWAAPGLSKSKAEMFEVRDKRQADLIESIIGSSFLKFDLDKSLEFIYEIDLFDKVYSNGVDGYLKNAFSAISSFYNSQVVEDFRNWINHLQRVLSLPPIPKEFIYLFLNAISHSSNVTETGSYERLEFLGDPVVDLIISEKLYEHSANLSPRNLSILRSAFVNQIVIGRLSYELGLPQLLFHNLDSISQLNVKYKFAVSKKPKYLAEINCDSESISKAWINMFKPPLPP
ncbi:P-loop containing nucleoside triphosphate hydrolase protein, partial [Rozella allomycis CSF55]